MQVLLLTQSQQDILVRLLGGGGCLCISTHNQDREKNLPLWCEVSGKKDPVVPHHLRVGVGKFQGCRRGGGSSGGWRSCSCHRLHPGGSRRGVQPAWACPCETWSLRRLWPRGRRPIVRVVKGFQFWVVFSSLARVWLGSRLSNWKEDFVFELWRCPTWFLINTAPPRRLNVGPARWPELAQTFKQNLGFLSKSFAPSQRRVVEVRFSLVLADQWQQFSLSEWLHVLDGQKVVVHEK